MEKDNISNKDRFNIVELALNGKEAAKQFCKMNLWFFMGLLLVVGILAVVFAGVIGFNAINCLQAGEDGLVCAMTIVPPTFL